MTHKEARRLKLGDRVAYLVRGTRRVAKIIPWADGRTVMRHLGNSLHFCVRPEGVTAGGRRRAVRLIRAAELLLERWPAATGNVFADWLEDNGEPRAAAKLRAAFPMASAEAS